MSRLLAPAVLLALAAVPPAARAQDRVETRTVAVGNAAIVDVRPNPTAGGPSAAELAARTPAQWNLELRRAMPMNQVLALPSPPRDR
jgi:hypothetical protein